ncbi:MAG: ATP-binding cassette domain-containing protein [Syntrophomonadaceae bacterium]|nr:ATP-binding cassette domain-containing protein [Syntrophomonadaceae bacterium]
MAELILEALDIEFSYPDGTRALKGLSLAITRGKKVAVVGPNGAGKSTLFLHLNGILRPNRGKVRFAGKDVLYGHSALMELRQNVGIVFQDPDTQLFSASVLQEISFGPLNLGLSRAEAMLRVERAMDETDTLELKQKPTHLLSFGQKKLVAIAGILAMDPAVLIFDEPTAGLDPKHAAKTMDLLDRINKSGRTVVVSTHDVNLALAWADYIYVLIDGVIAKAGTPEQVFQDDSLLIKAHLEKPWVLEVYGELSKNGLFSGGTTPIPRTKAQLLACIGAAEKNCGHLQVSTRKNDR